MGGAGTYSRRMRNNKNHKKGRRVNDPATYRGKHKRAVVFYSIVDDLDELDFVK